MVRLAIRGCSSSRYHLKGPQQQYARRTLDRSRDQGVWMRAACRAAADPVRYENWRPSQGSTGGMTVANSESPSRLWQSEAGRLEKTEPSCRSTSRKVHSCQCCQSLGSWGCPGAGMGGGDLQGWSSFGATPPRQGKVKVVHCYEWV